MQLPVRSRVSSSEGSSDSKLSDDALDAGRPRSRLIKAARALRKLSVVNAFQKHRVSTPGPAVDLRSNVDMARSRLQALEASIADANQARGARRTSTVLEVELSKAIQLLGQKEDPTEKFDWALEMRGVDAETADFLKNTLSVEHQRDINETKDQRHKSAEMIRPSSKSENLGGFVEQLEPEEVERLEQKAHAVSAARTSQTCPKTTAASIHRRALTAT
jgi:hypothetical protein